MQNLILDAVPGASIMLGLTERVAPMPFSHVLEDEFAELEKVLFGRVAQKSSVCTLRKAQVSADTGGDSHLIFCEHEALEDFSSEFRHDTLGLMRSARRLKHDDEERVFKGVLSHFHACIQSPPVHCAREGRERWRKGLKTLQSLYKLKR